MKIVFKLLVFFFVFEIVKTKINCLLINNNILMLTDSGSNIKKNYKILRKSITLLILWLLYKLILKIKCIYWFIH